jgi:hypothetical protein
MFTIGLAEPLSPRRLLRVALFCAAALAVLFPLAVVSYPYVVWIASRAPFAWLLLWMAIPAGAHALFALSWLELRRGGYEMGYRRFQNVRHGAKVAAARRSSARSFRELARMMPPRDEIALAPAYAGLDNAEMIEVAFTVIAERLAGEIQGTAREVAA